MRLEGFQETRINLGDVEINVNYAGSGKPILLLHGYRSINVEIYVYIIYWE